MAGSGSAGYEPGELVEAVLGEIDSLRASVATLTAQRNDRNFHLAAASAEIIQLRAQVATLTAERDTAQAATAKMAARCERLIACAEHYAADETWGKGEYDYWHDTYIPETDGWDFAREALATKEEKR